PRAASVNLCRYWRGLRWRSVSRACSSRRTRTRTARPPMDQTCCRSRRWSRFCVSLLNSTGWPKLEFHTPAMTRTLNLLAFVVFASALFIRSTDPVIPQIAYGLNVEPATAALLSTAFTLPYALVQPLLGALADMFSKVRLMLMCMVLVTAGTIVCGMAPNYEFLFIARVLAGLASGGVVPISFALVGDLVPFADRQVAMGRLLFAIMTGNLLGATCAGVVGDLLGWRGVFFVIGSLGALACTVGIVGFRGHSENGPGRFDLSNFIPNYRMIFKNPLAKI